MTVVYRDSIGAVQLTDIDTIQIVDNKVLYRWRRYISNNRVITACSSRKIKEDINDDICCIHR